MVLRKAWGDLRARKLRTALVVFSVAVAIFGVSAIRILGEQLERSAADKAAASNPPDLTVSTTPAGPGPRDALSVLPNVQTVEGRLVAMARWEPAGDGRRENVVIQGLPGFVDTRALDRVRVVRGAAPGPGGILFEKTARQKYGLETGRQVALIGPTGEFQYTITGFGENPNVLAAPVVGFASAWLHRDDAAALLDLRGDTRLLLRLHDASTAELREATQQRVRESLEGDEVTVLTSEARDPTTLPGQDVVAALNALLLVLGLFGAVASGLLVVNTLATLVVEQRPQIGVMKAIGGTTRHVLVTYLALALLYGVLGTALGLVAGLAFTALLEGARAAALDEAPSPILVSGQSLGLIVGLGLSSCLLAALLPSYLGARLTVRDALISYGLAGEFGDGHWDRAVLRLHGLPPAALLAARNVFRRPHRAWLTLGGLAVAVAMLLAVLATLNSLSRSLQAAGQVLRADLILVFDTLVERATVEAALADAAGLDRRELWLVASAKLGDKTVTVTGLPPDTGIFDTGTVRAGGRWLDSGSADEAVVTRRLAARHDLGVGSTVELASGTQPRRRWTVVGIVAGAGTDALAPEGAVYAPYEAVRALLDFPEGRGNQLYVRLADRSRAEIDARAPALADRLADAGQSNAPVKLYEQQENNQRIFAGFVLLFSATIAILALVGALGLLATLTINVLERRREIGVLRAVGAPTRALLATYVLEGLFLGLLGWGLGVGLGLPASRVLVNYFGATLIPLDYGFPVAGGLLTVLAIVGVALAASAGPALLAARLRIADILRYD